MNEDVSEVFADLTETLQVRLITKLPVDFEVKEQSEGVDCFELHLQPMPEQKILRKPEGERDWMWWEGWCERELKLDDEIQDSEGRVFKTGKKGNWSKVGGFFHYEFTETPQ